MACQTLAPVRRNLLNGTTCAVPGWMPSCLDRSLLSAHPRLNARTEQKFGSGGPSSVPTPSDPRPRSRCDNTQSVQPPAV